MLASDPATLPPDIAEAINELEIAAEQFGGQTWIGPEGAPAVVEARAALEAAILRHIGQGKRLRSELQRGKWIGRQAGGDGESECVRIVYGTSQDAWEAYSALIALRDVESQSSAPVASSALAQADTRRTEG